MTQSGGKKGPLNEIFVAAYRENGELAGFGVTEAAGKYKIPQLSAGNYKVEFFGPVFAIQYYKEKSTPGEATPVPVAEGLETTEINAALKELGRISGTVTELAGAKGPIPGLKVEVTNLIGEFEGEATTNAEGKYEVVGLETGKYKVGFNPFGELDYVPQYFNDQPSFETATPLLVEVEKTSEANAALQVGGEILGRVTDAHTGAPIAHILVFASKTEGFEGIGFAETNSNGEYRVVGLATGVFRLEFLSKPGEVQYINQPVNGVAVKQGLPTFGVNVALVRKVPIPTTPPVLSGNPVVGQTLSCSTGTWTGVPTIMFSYAWLQDGGVISGATGNTYVVQPADQGHELSCRVTATNPVGRTTVTSKAVKVPPPPSPPAPPLQASPPPTITNVTQSHPSWREGGKLATYARKRPPLGTTFKFVLNQQATVSFVFTQQVSGRKVRGSCVAQTRANRRKPSCNRAVRQGTLSFSGHSGLNTVAFQGRVSSSKKLPLGSYTLRLTALNSAGQRSNTRSLNFTIVR